MNNKPSQPVFVGSKLKPKVPPNVLYHGTCSSVIRAIQQKGLKKMTRLYVHMTDDIEAAISAGMRKGVPIVFRINAGLMNDMGHTFYQSDDGVWLVEYVPPEYLMRMPTER